MGPNIKEFTKSVANDVSIWDASTEILQNNKKTVICKSQRSLLLAALTLLFIDSSNKANARMVSRAEIIMSKSSFHVANNAILKTTITKADMNQMKTILITLSTKIEARSWYFSNVTFSWPSFSNSAGIDVLYKTYPYGASRLSNESGVGFSTGFALSIKS